MSEELGAGGFAFAALVEGAGPAELLALPFAELVALPFVAALTPALVLPVAEAPGAPPSLEQADNKHNAPTTPRHVPFRIFDLTNAAPGTALPLPRHRVLVAHCRRGRREG